VENETSPRKFESVYSTKVRAGKRRTYFFDVRQTKGEDYYVTLTESTKKFNSDGYERHKIFLYKEDFNRFVSSLEEVINHVKNELMPDYDYDEFTKRQAEWEQKRKEMDALEKEAVKESTPEDEVVAEENTAEEEGDMEAPGEVEEADPDEAESKEIDTEEDLSW
jgi:hypothetical protein